MFKTDWHGYYIVGERRYANKLAAVMDAVPMGHWPHWYFHDRFFENADWKTPTGNTTIQEEYRARARQIREMYDKVYVHFSGGMDSWTVLHSFLSAGLTIDGVIVRSVEHFTPQKANNKLVDTAVNLHAEVHTITIPELKKLLSKFNANVPIKIWNTAENTVEWWEQQKVDPFIANIIHPTAGLRVDGFHHDDVTVKETAAHVYGVDKPRLLYQNNQFYFYFLDVPINMQCVNEGRRRSVLFYWDPAGFNVLKTQAQIIKAFFLARPDLLPMISDLKTFDIEAYTAVIKHAIYPDYPHVWQTSKPLNQLHTEAEWWFYNDNPDHHGYKAYRVWLDTVTEYKRLINETIGGTKFESWLKKENNYSLMPMSVSKLYPV